MSEIKLFEVRYIGRAKTRPDGSQTALGWCGKSWSVVFPKPVLYDWFGVTTRPGEAGSLYNVLGVPATATMDDVKTAYRRMAKQWHPDRCKEPDAKRQFIAIQRAYEVLGGKRRAKYDAGLALQASLTSTRAAQVAENDYGYRSPLRCGNILVQGQRDRGRFIVEKILQWGDIFNNRGQTLVASWTYGQDAPTEEWTT